ISSTRSPAIDPKRCMRTSTPPRRSSGAHRQVTGPQDAVRRDPPRGVARPAPPRLRTAQEDSILCTHAAEVLPMPAPREPAAPHEPALVLSAEHTAITGLLADLRAGKREAFDQMLPLVYNELRRTARRELAARPSDTLSTT